MLEYRFFLERVDGTGEYLYNSYTDDTPIEEVIEDYEKWLEEVRDERPVHIYGWERENIDLNEVGEIEYVYK